MVKYSRQFGNWIYLYVLMGPESGEDVKTLNIKSGWTWIVKWIEDRVIRENRMEFGMDRLRIQIQKFRILSRFYIEIYIPSSMIKKINIQIEIIYISMNLIIY